MEPQRDLLTEEELIQTPATNGVRFADYIIDVIVFYAILFVILLMSAGSLDPNNTLVIYALTIGVLVAYYTLMEGATNGKTVGKYLMKTRAIKEDGTKLSFGDAFIRSLCRLVPFEPLSIFFGDGLWHDRWSKTRVIKE